MNKVEKADKFWKNFLTIKDELLDIDSLDDRKAEELLLVLDKYLKEFSAGVDFELSDLTPQGRDINFSALGDEDYFEDVITLVENAPVLDFFTVSAFKKAEGKNAEIEYEGIRLASKDMFFLPLESEEVTNKIGLTVAAKGLTKNDNTLAACYLLCEKMIGEYNAATLIDYFDIDNLPSDYGKQGFLPLDYLPDFTQWKIEKIETSK